MNPHGYLQAIHDEMIRRVLNGAEDLAPPLRNVLDLHSEFKIYDECDHQHQPVGQNGAWPIFDTGVAFVDGIGATCNYTTSVCTHCCTELGAGEYQNEECATEHDQPTQHPSVILANLAPCFPCLTVRTVGAALGIHWRDWITQQVSNPRCECSRYQPTHSHGVVRG